MRHWQNEMNRQGPQPWQAVVALGVFVGLGGGIIGGTAGTVLGIVAIILILLGLVVRERTRVRQAR